METGGDGIKERKIHISRDFRHNILDFTHLADRIGELMIELKAKRLRERLTFRLPYQFKRINATEMTSRYFCFVLMRSQGRAAIRDICARASCA